MNAVLVIYGLSIGLLAVWRPWRAAELAMIWERRAFWGLSVPLLAFTVFRPYGISNDDYAYWQIFSKLCPISECRRWIQSERDFVWYSLVAALKGFWPETRLMLAVSAGCLLIKLSVIKQLCKRPLLGLLSYVGLFYPIFDLTVLRISMASSLSLLGFYLVVRRSVFMGLPFWLLAGLVHKQAFSSPAMLLGSVMGLRSWVFPGVTGLFLVLLLAGWYPASGTVHELDLRLDELGLGHFGLAKDLWTYLNQKHLGSYDAVRVLPLSLFPLLAAVVWLARDLFEDDSRLYAYVAGSITVAMGCLWGLAVLPEVQMRFVHFFMVPVVFLFGNVRPEWKKVAPVLLVALFFFIRYGVLHPVFKMPCTLDWVQDGRCMVPVR